MMHFGHGAALQLGAADHERSLFDIVNLMHSLGSPLDMGSIARLPATAG
jgi:hypothetical protein